MKPPLQREPLSSRHQAAVLLGSLGSFMDLYTTQALFSTLQLRFALSPGDAGWLITATTLGLAIVSPMAGGIAGRVGSRRALLFGLWALALASWLMATVQTWSQLIVVRVLQGLCIPIVLCALLSSVRRPENGAAAFSASVAYVSGTIVGGVIGRLLPASLVTLLGWGSTFTVIGAMHALLALCVARLFVDEPTPASSPHAALVRGQRMWGARLLSLCCAGFCLLFAQTAVFTFIAIRLVEPPFQWSGTVVGLLYLVFLPSLLAVHSAPRLLQCAGASLTLLAAVIVGGCALAASLCTSGPLIILALSTFSITVFISQLVLADEIGVAVAPEARPWAAGRYLFFYYLGGSAGAITPAWLWPRHGWLGCIALVIGVQAIGLAVLIVGHSMPTRTPASQPPFSSRATPPRRTR